MKTFIQGSFRNKAAVIILVIMVLGLGVFSYFKLPMEFLPVADNPQVTVSVIGPGYDAASMEKMVADPLESAVAGVKGKIDLFSTSGDGFAQLNLNFDSKTNMKDAKSEVEKAVDAVKLPERVSTPYVVQFNTSMIPISFISLTTDGSIAKDQKDQIEQTVNDMFRSIKGVGTVQMFGKSQPQITIAPNLTKLTAKGVPVQSLYTVLQGREASSSVGAAEINGQTVNLNVVGSVNDVDTLRKLPVASGVTLGEVADVTFDPQNTEAINRVNGMEAISFVISKDANSNAVTVGKAVQKEIDAFNQDNKNAQLKLEMSTSDQVVHSVNSMIREVLMGALFATIVILIFMRNVRATLVTIVSIPLSLALTLFLLDLSGITLNVLTLGGVAVAVGRLVDDSIVVIENIFRRLQKESFSVDLIIDATREVATAITASTLTTVAVFLPMSLLRGSLQSFLLPFALTVTYALLSSLLVALTVIPLMSSGILKNTTIAEHKPSRRFASFLEWNLRFKWVPITLAVLLLVGSIGTYVSMPKGTIDSSDATNVSVSLSYKPDTPVEQVKTNGLKLESILMKQEGVDWVRMQMGNSAGQAQYGNVSSPTLVSYTIQMLEGANAQQFIEAVQSQRTSFPGADLTAGPGDFFGGSSGTQVFVDITGNDPDQLTKTASDVLAQIKPIPNILKVETNQDEKKTSYSLQVNPMEAKAGDIAAQLQGMINSVPIGSINVDGQEVNVLLDPIFKPQSPSDLNSLTVMTDTGPKPASSVAKWEKEEKPTQYYHKNGKSYVRVTATVDSSQLSLAGGDVKKAIANIKAPEGVQIIFGGASADQDADFSSLFMMALVSIGIVYLIMVFTFKTLKGPLAIMSSLLFVPIGAVLGLLIGNVTPDFTAIFGIVMLIGIVVTNAIVLIDRVRHNEERMTIREALIEGASTRMRPILMTAIATICAMLPLVFSSSESGSIVSKSLAVVVISGLTVATVFTLVLVPCFYELLYFRKSRRQRVVANKANEGVLTNEH